MRARIHGQTAYRLPQVAATTFALPIGGAQTDAVAQSFNPAKPSPQVGYMFPELQDDPGNRLPVSPEMPAALEALGRAMVNEPSSNDGPIPAAYTYFGQFIDHDITKTSFDLSLKPASGKDIIDDASLVPLAKADLSAKVFNDRSFSLDLDSVYEGDARDSILPDGRFRIGLLSPSGFNPIPTIERTHDLPRRDPDPTNKALDRAALIGDPRNDENLLVAQTHVAFLRSHNRLIDRGLSFDQARRAVRRRYQWAVLHDFLPRVCDPSVIHEVLANGPSFFKPATRADMVMPVEFSAAAYRFGHSMIREAYDHNATFGPPPAPGLATFNFLFTFTALSGDISPAPGPSQEFPTLPDNWTIDWRRFFGTAANPASLNPARLIDTHLMPVLSELPNEVGEPIVSLMGVLAARNLRRGYLLGLPTGQAVAATIGVAPLARQVLVDAVALADRPMVDAAGLFDRTPLWFYVLAEAGDAKGPEGKHLGPVGSRIIAETLWNCARFAQDSVIVEPQTPEEQATGEFSLKGLIRIGIDDHFASF